MIVSLLNRHNKNDLYSQKRSLQPHASSTAESRVNITTLRIGLDHSERLVLCATPKRHPNQSTTRFAFAMAFSGSAPYMTSLACKEAWSVLERMKQHYIKLVPGSIYNLPLFAGTFWFDPSRTVVHLGNYAIVLYILWSLDMERLAKVEHVSLWWYERDILKEACTVIASECPKLRNLILCSCKDSLSWGTPAKPLDTETAECYATIALEAAAESSVNFTNAHKDIVEGCLIRVDFHGMNR